MMMARQDQQEEEAAASDGCVGVQANTVANNEKESERENNHGSTAVVDDGNDGNDDDDDNGIGIDCNSDNALHAALISPSTTTAATITSVGTTPLLFSHLRQPGKPSEQPERVSSTKKKQRQHHNHRSSNRHRHNNHNNHSHHSGDDNHNNNNNIIHDDEDEPLAEMDDVSYAIENIYPFIIFVVLLLVWPLGYLSFVKLQQLTDSTFHPLSGSPSQAAQDAFAAAYSIYNSSNSRSQDPLNPPLYVVLEAASSGPPPSPNNNNNSTSNTTTKNISLVDSSSPSFQQARNYTLELTQYLNTRCWSWGQFKNTTTTTCDPVDMEDTSSSSTKVDDDDDDSSAFWFQVTDYYSLLDQDLDWMAGAMATLDGRFVLMQIQCNLPPPTSTTILVRNTSNDNNNNNNKRGNSRTISSNYNNNNIDRSRIREVMDAIETFGRERASADQSFFTLHYTGLTWFQRDLAQAAHQDLRRMDVVVLPLALILMGMVLPRANPFAVWIIPLLSMITTVCCWSMVMSFVATRMQITQFTPTIMMSLSIGMGIDYTMFLLARFLEVPSTSSVVARAAAISRMLCQGGQVLLLSGITLLFTFLGLCFLPLPMLKSVGIGAAVAIASALLVNLTLVPALLFSPIGGWIVRKGGGGYVRGDDMIDFGSNSDGAPLLTSSPTNESSSSSDIALPPPPSIWYRLSRHLLHPYRGIIILLITIQVILPIAMYGAQLKSSVSFDLMLPSTSPALQIFHTLSSQEGWGGGGRLNPYRILFDGRQTPSNLTMTSLEGFEVMHLVLNKLMAIEVEEEEVVEEVAEVEAMTWSASSNNVIQQQQDEEDMMTMRSLEELQTRGGGGKKKHRAFYNGISVLQNMQIPHSVFVSAKICSQVKPHCPVELLHVLEVTDQMATSNDGRATFVTASLGVNPFSDEGVAWLTSARESIQQLQASGALRGVDVHVLGVAAIEYDALQAVYATFPRMILITTLVVFTIMGIFFRSVFLPLRSIVSIGLTLAFSFGLGVLVYEKGLADWTGVRSFSTLHNEFCWLVPIMSFSLIVGLALDYDVFLVSRILEYRLEGYEHKTSIAAALHSTGSIITAAGGIMAFAFGSLLFSSSPVLYQWSFLITTAVLFDTFLVRTVVVPILTGMAGSQQCWWPRHFPETRVTMPEFLGGIDDVSSLLRTLEESSEYESLQTAISRHQNNP